MNLNRSEWYPEMEADTARLDLLSLAASRSPNVGTAGLNNPGPAVPTHTRTARTHAREATDHGGSTSYRRSRGHHTGRPGTERERGTRPPLPTREDSTMSDPVIPPHLLVFNAGDWPGKDPEHVVSIDALIRREAWRRAQDAWAHGHSIDRAAFEQLQRHQLTARKDT